MTHAVQCRHARLPLASVYMAGPRWRQAFDVIAATSSRHGVVLLYDFEADVRELVLVPLRHDVMAQWSDPREQLGLA